MRDDDIDDTVIRRPAVPRSDDAGGDVGGDGVDDALGDTVIRPVRGGRPDASATEDTIVRVPARPGAGGETQDGATPRLPAAPTGPPAPIEPPAPAPVRRVPSIRIGDRVLPLDRPVIVGRRPALPRITRGPAPELVTVPSATGQVSSSHVLVHAEGEAAVVDDLRSTNGTVVRPAGAAPFRMPAGASNVVLTGTVVEIGDGNVIEVLSPHLRVASSTRDLPPLPPWPTDPPAGPPRTPRERS
ncbi:hypothetical protein [Curtobacterium sp. MCBA15_008]|uniref:hypothetical protein n=1 Tax=Curtobacterium sp. MCBA15_008 TaxID=1898736 RepID=UPI0008DD5755|nr:hypothetical protein [Curtobacterium sp. MCBA15_008]OII13535.1 hypothetical protein BIU96_01715 [Curtobacterium sp. MCBA15_008]